MAANSVSIVSTSEQDLPEIAGLARVIWRACYPGIITAEQIEFMLHQMYSQEALLADLRVREISYARLIDNQRLLGFAAFGPTTDAATFMLHKLYLHPEGQGRGLGSRLLRHCECEAFGRGARALKLRVNKRNAHAMQVYQRNGYRVCDAVCTPIGGGFFMDDFVMFKALCGER